MRMPVKVHGDYDAEGYAHIEGLVPPEVAEAFLGQLKADLAAATTQFDVMADPASANAGKIDFDL